MADVELVDQPARLRGGLARGRRPRRRTARVTIRANEFETQPSPPVAVAAGGTLQLLNATPEAHTISCPRSAW
jgi:hypothetical protein